nr:hypothetical protein [Tanacetum cinerariifolium]
MDDPNITMEEYIRLEKEKACRRGKVYNWKTATYGKIWYDEDVHDLRSVETKFPAIVFNDAISFDESDDEDYTVLYNKNSFSYKIISIDDLKMDLENDDYKFNMPSFLSSEPTVSYFDDFDYFKDFENEFPAIAYNDALTSKLDFSKPIDKDNDNDKVDIEHSLGDLSIKLLPNTLKKSSQLPDFEEYAVSTSADTPYMIHWSTIKRNTFSANTPSPKPQYFVSEDQILRIRRPNTLYWSILRI